MITNIRIPFFICCIIALTACVPTKPFVSTEVRDIREVPGLSKAEIFSKTRQWFLQHFVSGKSVVDYENKNEGVIIGNGIAQISGGIISESIKYNIKIEAKDGKFRASTTIIEHRNTDSNSTYTASYIGQERIDNGTKKVAEVVTSLEKYIRSSASEKSDW